MAKSDKNAPEQEAPKNDAEQAASESKLPDNASSSPQNANTNTRAEEFELNRTVGEDGNIIENATGSNTSDGDDSSIAGRSTATAPGTDNSTAELIKVKTSGAFLFHDPFTGSTVDNSDNGGNENGIIRSSLVDNALADGRLEEI